MQPQVSVVIPTYNRAASIRRAIDSVLAQRVPLEVIVVDDGSTDDTVDQLRHYAERIRVISQSNQGVASARNRGVAAAHGEFVAFLDSDDEWLPNKLERQLALMARHPTVGLVSAAAEYVDPAGAVRNVGTTDCSGRLLDVLLFENVVLTSAALVRRRCLDELDVLFESRLSHAEDWGLWLRIAARHDVIVSPEIMVRYHISSDGLTVTAPLDRYERICRALYDEPGDPLLAEAVARLRRDLEANIHLLSAIVAYDLGRPWRARRELIKAIAKIPRRLKWTTILRIGLLSPRVAQAISSLRLRFRRREGS